MGLTDAERDGFDALLEDVLAHLPQRLVDLFEEAPLIVEDRPSPAILADLGMDEDEPLCGLHSGPMITERSVEDSGILPEDIRIFREGIIDLAGGWDGPDAADRVREEIRITVLHELGHHFGLDEDDLERLGYE